MSARPLRIAVWHNLPSGGGKRALWQHVRGLVQRGHQVTAYCPPPAAGGSLPLGGWCQEHALPLAAGRRPWAPRRWRWWAQAREVQRVIAAHRAHAAAVAARIAAAGCDVLLAASCAEFAAPAIGRAVTLPKVLYLGEPRRQLYEALPELPWPAPPPASGAATCTLGALARSSRELGHLRLRLREERDNAAAFDRILVNSAFSRESVLRAYGLDAEVCELGVDTDLFRPTDAPRGDYVLGLGAVQPHKGVDRAILALAALPKAARPSLCWVANDAGADYRAAMERLAREQQVALTVRLQIDDAHLVPLLAGAQALLYTSRLEPFGFAPLEANACGTPVVAVAEGGVRESLVDGVHGVLAADARPATLAHALQRLLGDPALAAAVRRTCRDAVAARYSLRAADERLETALRAAVAAR